MFSAYAQYLPNPSVELLPPICSNSNMTNCGSLEQFLNKAIYSPMMKTDVVFVGNIVEVTKNPDYYYPEYDIAVEYYLKNPKPQDLLHVADLIIESKSAFNSFYENYPALKKGDSLFVYLKGSDGKYSLMPNSFLIPKIDVGPHMPVNFRPLSNEIFADKIIGISGAVDKGYLYKRIEHGSDPTVRIRIVAPDSTVHTEDVVDVNPSGAFLYNFDIFRKYPRSGTYDVFILVGDSATGISFDYVSSVKINERKWIECVDDFQLVTKASDGTINCVKQESTYSLMLRGWAKTDKVFITNVFTKNPNHSIENGRLISAVLDDATKTLIFNIESFGDGTLTVSIPRQIIDARLGPDGHSGEDDSFFVLVDGMEVAFDEVADPIQRTLTINFPVGAKTIEIIGSFPI